MNQMKLFKTFAATAAVITCCLGNSLPAEARWQRVTSNSEGKDYFIKNVKCGGPICEWDYALEGGGTANYGVQINCNTWDARFRKIHGSGWFEWETMRPGTIHNAAAERVCS